MNDETTTRERLKPRQQELILCLGNGGFPDVYGFDDLTYHALYERHYIDHDGRGSWFLTDKGKVAYEKLSGKRW